MVKLPFDLVERYSDTIAHYGPDSPQAEAIRQENACNKDFLVFAASLDRVKRVVGGSGVEYPPGERPAVKTHGRRHTAVPAAAEVPEHAEAVLGGR